MIGRGKIAKWPKSKLNERLRRLVTATLRAYGDTEFGRHQATHISKLLVMGWHKHLSNQEIIDKIEQTLVYGRLFANGPSQLSQAIFTVINTGDR